jgi:phage shock protein E
MQKALFALLTILLLLVGCTRQKDNVSFSATKITPEKAMEMMGQDVVILDVRTQAEFDEGHIPNALLIPDGEIKHRAEEVLTDKDQTIIVYCRSGRRSALAAKSLIDLGYTNVYDLGGILDWTGEIVK